MPDDETRKRTAHGYKVPGRKARTTLGDRFYRGKARQVRVLLSVSSGRYFLWVGSSNPTKRETATMVAKKLLKEIVPRFGLLVTAGADNGPAFVSQIVQGLA